MAAKRFEDLDVWQAAKKLAVLIYQTTEKENIKKDYGFKDQLRRASISIVSNIAEGFERNGNREFIQFLSLAKGSAGEVRAQLHVSKEIGYVSDEEFQFLQKESEIISKMLYSFIERLKYTDMKGTKFVREGVENYKSSDLEL
jgi:four helix bundle protein